MFKRKERDKDRWGKLPDGQSIGETYVDTTKVAEEFAEKLKSVPEPTIVDGFEDELKQIEELIRTREDEIRDLNVRVVELSSQIGWLKRTPQAVTILTALKKRYTGV